VSSSYWWYKKNTVGPTFVRTESLSSRAIFKNVLGAFYRGWYVVVHPYSNFSIRRQMAREQSIKFQTAIFPIFCTRIIVIFWTTCIAREVFSLVIMGNVTHILPALHCLEVVIAFVSSLLPAGSSAGSSAGIVFTHGPIFVFFAPQGRHVAPIKVKFGTEKR